jgi:hypothetical protein
VGQGFYENAYRLKDGAIVLYMHSVPPSWLVVLEMHRDARLCTISSRF